MRFGKLSLNSMKTPLLLTSLTLGLGLAAGGLYLSQKTWADKEPIMEVATEKPVEPTETVVKKDEEWKEELTPEQYRILREAGTERAFGQVYKEFKGQGAGKYVCVGCNILLFTSTEKFDSGLARIGWTGGDTYIIYSYMAHRNKWEAFYENIPLELAVERIETSGFFSF